MANSGQDFEQRINLILNTKTGSLEGSKDIKAELDKISKEFAKLLSTSKNPQKNAILEGFKKSIDEIVKSIPAMSAGVEASVGKLQASLGKVKAPASLGTFVTDLKTKFNQAAASSIGGIDKILAMGEGKPLTFDKANKLGGLIKQKGQETEKDLKAMAAKIEAAVDFVNKSLSKLGGKGTAAQFADIQKGAETILRTGVSEIPAQVNADAKLADAVEQGTKEIVARKRKRIKTLDSIAAEAKAKKEDIKAADAQGEQLPKKLDENTAKIEGAGKRRKKAVKEVFDTSFISAIPVDQIGIKSGAQTTPLTKAEAKESRAAYEAQQAKSKAFTEAKIAAAALERGTETLAAAETKEAEAAKKETEATKKKTAARVRDVSEAAKGSKTGRPAVDAQAKIDAAKLAAAGKDSPIAWGKEAKRVIEDILKITPTIDTKGAKKALEEKAKELAKMEAEMAKQRGIAEDKGQTNAARLAAYDALIKKTTEYKNALTGIMQLYKEAGGKGVQGLYKEDDMKKGFTALQGYRNELRQLAADRKSVESQQKADVSAAKTAAQTQAVAQAEQRIATLKKEIADDTAKETINGKANLAILEKQAERYATIARQQNIIGKNQPGYTASTTDVNTGKTQAQVANEIAAAYNKRVTEGAKLQAQDIRQLQAIQEYASKMNQIVDGEKRIADLESVVSDNAQLNLGIQQAISRELALQAERARALGGLSTSAGISKEGATGRTLSNEITDRAKVVKAREQELQAQIKQEEKAASIKKQEDAILADLKEIDKLKSKSGSYEDAEIADLQKMLVLLENVKNKITAVNSERGKGNQMLGASGRPLLNEVNPQIASVKKSIADPNLNIKKQIEESETRLKQVERQAARVGPSLLNGMRGVRDWFRSFRFLVFDIRTALMGFGGIYLFKKQLTDAMEFEYAVTNIRNTINDFVAIAKGKMSEAEAAVRGVGKQFFGASKAAEGFLGIARAGLTGTESVKMLDEAMKFAAANGNDMDVATKLLVMTMKSFDLQVGQTGRAVNVYTKAIMASQMDMEKMVNAMKYAGPVAKAFNNGLEDTVTILSALVDLGYEGGTAGQYFRYALVDLNRQVATNANMIGKMGLNIDKLRPSTNSLKEVVNYLAKTSVGVEQMAQLVGVRAGPAFARLIQAVREGSLSLSDFKDQLDAASKTNIVQKAYENMIKTTKGLWMQVSALGEEVRLLAFGEFKDSIDGVAESFKGLLMKVEDFIKTGGGMKTIVDTIKVVASAIASFASGFMTPVSGIIYLVEQIASLVLWGQKAADIFKYVGLAVGVFVTYRLAVAVFVSALGKMLTVASGLKAMFAAQSISAAGWGAAIKGVGENLKLAMISMASYRAAARATVVDENAMTLATNNLKIAMTGLKAAISAALGIFSIIATIGITVWQIWGEQIQKAWKDQEVLNNKMQLTNLEGQKIALQKQLAAEGENSQSEKAVRLRQQLQSIDGGIARTRADLNISLAEQNKLEEEAAAAVEERRKQEERVLAVITEQEEAMNAVIAKSGSKIAELIESVNKQASRTVLTKNTPKAEEEEQRRVELLTEIEQKIADATSEEEKFIHTSMQYTAVFEERKRQMETLKTLQAEQTDAVMEQMRVGLDELAQSKASAAQQLSFMLKGMRTYDTAQQKSIDDAKSGWEKLASGAVAQIELINAALKRNRDEMARTADRGREIDKLQRDAEMTRTNRYARSPVEEMDNFLAQANKDRISFEESVKQTTESKMEIQRLIAKGGDAERKKAAALQDQLVEAMKDQEVLRGRVVEAVQKTTVKDALTTAMGTPDEQGLRNLDAYNKQFLDSLLKQKKAEEDVAQFTKETNENLREGVKSQEDYARIQATVVAEAIKAAENEKNGLLVRQRAIPQMAALANGMREALLKAGIGDVVGDQLEVGAIEFREIMTKLGASSDVSRIFKSVMSDQKLLNTETGKYKLNMEDLVKVMATVAEKMAAIGQPVDAAVNTGRVEKTADAIKSAMDGAISDKPKDKVEELQKKLDDLQQSVEQNRTLDIDTSAASAKIEQLKTDVQIVQEMIANAAAAAQAAKEAAEESRPAFAEGGPIGGGYGGGDRIPIRAEAGEYVVRKEAVRMYGHGFLNMVNRMSLGGAPLPNVADLPRRFSSKTQFATGGMVNGSDGSGGKEITVKLKMEGEKPMQFRSTESDAKKIIRVLDAEERNQLW